jgi:hypothetical protein
VVLKRTVEGFGRGLASEVVVGGAQPARQDEHYRPAGQAFPDGSNDRLAVVGHAESVSGQDAQVE